MAKFMFTRRDRETGSRSNKQQTTQLIHIQLIVILIQCSIFWIDLLAYKLYDQIESIIYYPWCDQQS